MQPENTNYAQSNKYSVTIARCPTVQYFCQVVSLPGVSMGEAIQNTPFIDAYSPGDKLIYDYLTCTFLVDEDLKNWLEVHDWLRALTFPESFEEYRNLGKLPPITHGAVAKQPQYSDISVTIYNSAQRPNLRFKFLQCFPTTLSPLLFSSADSPENIMTADVTFRFLLFNLDR